jgi:hypothetical protein
MSITSFLEPISISGDDPIVLQLHRGVMSFGKLETLIVFRFEH